ncbi:MAG TPA: FmdB family zinc ribbon protein [Dehalococcoidales bacterium]|nr:FmdB family zinc ribbon protein [Dehalococcoidales bacterium]
MPTYEYECSLCHHRFERRQNFADEPVDACPKCEGKSRRVIHSVPVIFRGSGFYVTDSRKTSHPGKKEKKPGKGKPKEPAGE